MTDLAKLATDAFDKPEEPVKEETVEPKEEPKTEKTEEVEKPAEDKETEEETVDLELEEEAEEEKAPELPPANKYVYDKLPFITVKGKTADGKFKDFKVKIPDELPDDFEFASGKELALYNAKVADQSNLATKYFQDYQKEQQEAQIKTMQAQEEREIVADMIELQNDGILPKFKYAASDKRFNDDEAVKEVNKILKYHEDMNKKYVETGKMYRIPFNVAVKSYYTDHPKEAAKNKEQATKEAIERNKVVSKTAGNGGTTAKSSKSPYRYNPALSLKAIADREANLAGL